LKNVSITTQDDLSYIKFEDLPGVISVVKRRKLSLIGEYLNLGGPALVATTTIQEVKDFVKDKSKRTGSTAPANADSAGGGLKVHTNPLKEFSGDPVEYEDWEKEALATLRQTVYKPFMDRAADPNKPNEVKRKEELYNIILAAVLKGHACDIVEKLKDDANIGENGYEAWKALQAWYMDPSQKSTMIDFYIGKLNALALDRVTTATEFINNFCSYMRKLESLEDVTWSDEKKLREFKNRVTDEDYDTEKCVHDGNFESLIKNFRTREQDLEKEALKSQGKTQRRFKRQDEADHQDKRGSDDSSQNTSKKGKVYIPYVPNFLFKLLDKNGKANIRKWRDLTNAGKTIVKDDLVIAEDDDKGNKDDDKSSESGKPPSKKKQKQGKGKKNRRVTTKGASSTLDDTVDKLN
jgi:hypothetical protein